MEYLIFHNSEQHQFELKVDEREAVLEYFLNHDTMVITHTYVPQILEGRGIGAALTRKALEFASEKNLKVIPVCSFAEAYIKRHPEYQRLINEN